MANYSLFHAMAGETVQANDKVVFCSSTLWILAWGKQRGKSSLVFFPQAECRSLYHLLLFLDKKTNAAFTCEVEDMSQ